jgi:hypothetical protein
LVTAGFARNTEGVGETFVSPTPSVVKPEPGRRRTIAFPLNGPRRNPARMTQPSITSTGPKVEQRSED